MRGKRPLVVTPSIAVLALAACSGPAGSPAGEHLWTLQFGTAESDEPDGVAVDGNGRIVVAGTTRGDLVGTNAGARDAFVRVYTADRTVAWTRQFGTVADDASRGLAIGPEGQAIVAGRTGGDLGGPNAGADDAFLRAYGP